MSAPLLIAGCGDDDGGSTTPDAAVMVDAAMQSDAPAVSPGEELFALISGDNDYTDWNGFPGFSDVIAYEGHGTSHRRVFVNTTAEGDIANLPDGSIIVKENLTNMDPDAAGALDSITVMQRKGTDWFWGKFAPDGTVQVEGLSDEVTGGCTSAACHGDTAGTGDDYSFLNNQAVEAGTLAATLWDTISADNNGSLEYTTWNDFGSAAPAVAPRESNGHGPSFKRVFINDTAEGDEANLPAGSILVKEELEGDDAATAEVVGITVMQKIQDFDTDGDDWLWAKYNPDGSMILVKGYKDIVGCTNDACHGDSTGTAGDYVFLNNE